MRYVIPFVASYVLSACTITAETSSDDETMDEPTSTGETRSQTTGATSSSRDTTSSRPSTSVSPGPSHSSATVAPNDVAPTSDAAASDATTASSDSPVTTDGPATQDTETNNPTTAGSDASTSSASSTTTEATTSEALEGCEDGPLDEPIPGCEPEFEETGDYYADCVDRINQFRWECQCLPPLERNPDGEACADEQAQHDFEVDEAHAGFSAMICQPSGSGQNECPGYGGQFGIIDYCLQQMWDEGPGEDFSAHGHYINMTNPEFSSVACGTYTTPDGEIWAVQNFFR